MTTALWLRDIGSFGLQIAVIVTTGALIWRLLNVRDSVITLAYWRTLLLACLLLPLCQPWHLETAPPLDTAARAVVTDISAAAILNPGAVPMPSRSTFPVGEAVLGALLAGVAARTLWLLVAAGSLRRLRRAAAPLDPLPAFVRDALARVGARAEVYVSDRITGPITFGVRRPVVMLPPSVLEMQDEVQEAIAIHELVHVRRRDWLHVVLEEVVRTVLWFHPAIWWLTNRIQLSREHVVDQAVIRLTQSRDRYVEALLAVALTGTHGTFAPAPLFLRRRFLKKRVAHILQETAMTTRRLIASVTVSACALVLAAVLAVRSFPLEARSEIQDSSTQAAATVPVQIINGGEHLLHGDLPEYPPRAFEQRIEGDVILDLTVDERGEVSDARVVSGPEELRRNALESVLRWHYSPDAIRSSSTQVALRFRAVEAEVLRGFATVAGREEAERERRQEIEVLVERFKRQQREFEKAAADPATPDGQKIEGKLKLVETEKLIEQLVARRSGTEAPDVERNIGVAGTGRLSQIRTERVPPAMVEEIRTRAGISIGDLVNEAAAKRIKEAAVSIDEHLRVSFMRDKEGGFVLLIVAP